MDFKNAVNWMMIMKNPLSIFLLNVNNFYTFFKNKQQL